MDTQIQRRSLIAFYFGTKVATANVTSEQAIHGVARRAYADLQRTLRGFGTHQSRSERVSDCLCAGAWVTSCLLYTSDAADE